jgi:hypothetical protein
MIDHAWARLTVQAGGMRRLLATSGILGVLALSAGCSSSTPIGATRQSTTPTTTVTRTTVTRTTVAASTVPPTTVAPPTVPPTTVSVAANSWPTQCLSGSASVVVSHSQNPPLCVSVGTQLTLIFDPPTTGGFVNSWMMPPVSSSLPSIASVEMTKEAGSVLTAHLHVKTPGTTQIQANVFLECSQSNPTPCDSGAPTTTDPSPPSPLTVNVTVPAST